MVAGRRLCLTACGELRRLKSNILYCIVLYCIVLYCMPQMLFLQVGMPSKVKLVQSFSIPTCMVTHIAEGAVSNRLQVCGTQIFDEFRQFNARLTDSKCFIRWRQQAESGDSTVPRVSNTKIDCANSVYRVSSLSKSRPC